MGWAGLRNVLAHHYASIDYAKIAATLANELQDLEQFVGAGGRVALTAQHACGPWRPSHSRGHQCPMTASAASESTARSGLPAAGSTTSAWL